MMQGWSRPASNGPLEASTTSGTGNESSSFQPAIAWSTDPFQRPDKANLLPGSEDK
jgi:hypothetical protein